MDIPWKNNMEENTKKYITQCIQNTESGFPRLYVHFAGLSNTTYVYFP